MKQLILMSLPLCLLACNGGSSSSTTNSANGNYSGISPYPYPPAGSFFIPPIIALPNFSSISSNGLQIAYGSQDDARVVSLVAQVTIAANGICSATPISAQGGTTWLVSAAHCFVTSSNGSGTLSVINVGNVKINSGFNSQANPFESTISVKRIYVPQNYCAGGSFSSLGGCGNFNYTSSSAESQGNDIALIQAVGIIANPESYPQLSQAANYPPAYTMAPVLSLGYGINTQQPNPAAACTGTSCNVLYYVTNYFYLQSDNPGYHYLQNSYFNPAAATSNYYGYSELICNGDSGGGDLYWSGSKWLLLSEHTYGPPGSACGVFYASLPNASTNVSSYYSWLSAIIANPASCDETANCVHSF